MSDLGYRPCVGVMLVNSSGRVFVGRRIDNKEGDWWQMPQGGVDEGEDLEEAALRELAEETGVTATPRRYLDNVDLIRRDNDGALQFHFLLAAVQCDYVAGQPVAADDALEAGWWPVQHVLSGALPLSAHVDTILRRALAGRYDL